MIHFRFFLLLAFTALLRSTGFAQEVSCYTATASDVTFAFNPTRFFTCNSNATGEPLNLFNLKYAQVYVAGAFNGWQIEDPAWKLTATGGIHTLTVPHDRLGKAGDTLQFKFVIRGTGIEDNGTRKTEGLWWVNAPSTASNRMDDGSGNVNPYLVVGKAVAPQVMPAPPVAVFPAQPAGGFLISGVIKEAGNHEIRVFAGSEVIASGRANGGKFALAGTVAQPTVTQLTVGEFVYEAVLMLENIPFTVNGSLAAGATLTINGGKEQATYTKMASQLETLRKPVKTAAFALMEAQQNGAANLPALERQYQHLDTVFCRSVFQLNQKYSSSLAGVALLNDFAFTYTNYVPFSDRMALLNAMPPALQANPVTQRVREVWEKEHALVIGALAPDFTLNDSLGKPVTLSSLRGQYVLVDFWASWCRPCRAENPNVKNAYAEYHPKGLEIIGIAIDDDFGNWTAAIRKDGLPWINTLDRDRSQQSVNDLYNITFVPQNFLLDKEGRIIAIRLRGDELQKKLAELMP